MSDSVSQPDVECSEMSVDISWFTLDMSEMLYHLRF